MAKKGYHNARSLNYSGQLSYDYFIHDEKGNIVNNVSKDDWKNLIREKFKGFIVSGECSFIVFIFHDKDVDKDGNVKGLHVHFIIKFSPNKQREKNVVIQLFGISREKDCDILKNSSRAFQYLLHITSRALQEKKFIYNFSDIEFFTNDNSFDLMRFFYPTKKDSKDDKEFVNSLHLSVLRGISTVSEVRSVILATDGFGATSWRTMKKSFEDDEKEYLQEVNSWYSVHNACKTTIFISGGGGSQKTDLAQMVIAPHFSDIRGVHVPASPMGRVTYDPIGTYSGQRVSILNEIKGSSWCLEGFCECLDPTHSGLTGSRYYDRPYFPSYVVMTTSDTVDTFVSDVFRKWYCSNDGCESDLRYIPVDAPTSSVWNKIWQVRRRIPILIDLDGVNKMAAISLLDYSRENYLLHSPNCYVHFASVPYSLTDDLVKKTFLSTLDNAIDTYYKMNNFTITPATVELPVIKL